MLRTKTLTILLLTWIGGGVSAQDVEGFPGLDADDLNDVIEEAEALAGRPEGSTEVRVRRGEGPYVAETSCDRWPSTETFVIRIYVDEMLTKYGVTSEDYDGLLTQARDDLLGTLVHEMGHLCLREKGVPCAGEGAENEDERMRKYRCEEIAIDHWVHSKLCAAAQAACAAYCAALAAADTPPTSGQAAHIADLEYTLLALCRQIAILEGVYNDNEELAERACECARSGEFPSSEACEILPPPPPPTGGSDPPEWPEDCDFEGGPIPLFPPCGHCDCVCPQKPEIK